MEFTILDLTVNNLASVVLVHQSAFPSSALTKLGGEAIRRYYEWQIIGPHEAIAIGILDQERFIGFCFAGVFRGSLGGFLEKNRRYLIWLVITHPWLLFNPLFRERAFFALRQLALLVHKMPKKAISPKPMTKSFGILSIAIDPFYHGKGAAQLLLEYAENLAITRGFTLMALTVHPSNTRAVHFYEKMGWQRIPEGINWAGHMQKSLVT